MGGLRNDGRASMISLRPPARHGNAPAAAARVEIPFPLRQDVSGPGGDPAPSGFSVDTPPGFGDALLRPRAMTPRGRSPIRRHPVTTLRLAACLALAAVLAAAPAGAEDAKALLKKLDERTYYPQDHGLKDLSVNIVLSGGPMMSGMNIVGYWKAPDKKRCVVELPPMLKNMPGMSKDALKKQAASYNKMMDAVVPTRQADSVDLYDYTVEKDGDLTKITGKRKEGAKQEMPEQTILWIDAKPSLVKMTTVSKGTRSEMTNIQYDEKGGKLLMRKFEMTTASPQLTAAGMPPQKSSMEMVYTEVESIWLLSTVKMGGGMMGNFGYVIKDHAVNKGLPDATFIVTDDE
jgi:hypothetical protein